MIMAGSALKRLMAEYKRKRFKEDFYTCHLFILLYIFPSELTRNPPEGIVAGPKSEENFFEWEALITYEILKHTSNTCSQISKICWFSMFSRPLGQRNRVADVEK